MTEPRFRVLDVVEPNFDSPDQGSGRLVVSSIRRYADDRYRYSVGSDDSGDDRAGIYDENQLRPTGERVDLEDFAVPGPFRHRDIVTIVATYDDPRLAGQVGEVDGWQEPFEELPLLISVWLEDLGEVCLIEQEALLATGRRVPAEVPGRSASSALVSGDGELLGNVDYVVVDDITFHL